jgi:hypothetical protein
VAEAADGGWHLVFGGVAESEEESLAGLAGVALGERPEP